MQLIRATKKNGIFHELEAQWKGQLAKYGDSIEDYIFSFREHSKVAIAADHKNYFVYVLEQDGAYEGFVHVNHARIKHFDGKTIRALEIFLAPVYDYEDVSPQKMAELASGLIINLLKLSEKELSAPNIKIHIGPLDKAYLAAFAKLFGDQLGISMKIEGSWLVIRK